MAQPHLDPIGPHDRPPLGKADALALLTWTATVIAFFWDAVSFRDAFFYFDITEINFPYRDFLANELKAGRFSRWHPGLYCGLPLFSESQAGYLHPLKYPLYLLLPTWKAFNLDCVLSIWLTGVFGFGWLRRHLGTAGAAAGAVVVAFGGYTWAHFIHTSMLNSLVSVPLAFWGIEAAWGGARIRGLVVAAFALACQVFAGHLQDTILTGMALGLYGLYRSATATDWRARAYGIGSVAAVGLIAIGLSAVQWIPSKELIDRSPRQELTWEDLTYGSWHPELLPTLLVREVYGTRARDTDWMDGFYPYHEMDTYLGVVALILAVIGVGAYRDRWVGFWVILGVVGGLLMLGRHTFVLDRFQDVPILGHGRVPVRYHMWVTLAVGALAGVGVDRLAKGESVRLRGAAWTIAGIALASLPILIFIYRPAFTEGARWLLQSHADRYRWLAEDVAIGSLRALGLISATFIVCRLAIRARRPARRAVWVATLPALAALDLLAAHWHDTPTVDPAYWTEPPPSARLLQGDPSFQRVVGEGTYASGEPGYASEPVDFLAVRELLAWSLPPVWGLPSTDGITPIFPARRLRYTDLAQGPARFDVESLSHLVRGSPAPESGLSARRAGSVYVLKNPNALPRARVVGRPYYVPDEVAAGIAVARLGQAIRERLIVEDADRPVPEDAEPVGSARIAADLPERVVVEVDSDRSAYLFLADTYDPGWSATIDGVPAPIRPAHVTFRAVAIPEGPHQVVFTYEPVGFRPGLWISLASLVVAVVLLFVPVRGVRLGPSRGPSGWHPAWPWGLFAIVLLILAASTIRFESGGHLTAQSRWSGTFHRFTWGAGIEAIRPRPPAYSSPPISR